MRSNVSKSLSATQQPYVSSVRTFQRGTLPIRHQASVDFFKPVIRFGLQESLEAPQDLLSRTLRDGQEALAQWLQEQLKAYITYAGITPVPTDSQLDHYINTLKPQLADSGPYHLIEKTANAAYIDALTGLYNRGYFDTQFNTLVEYAKQHQQKLCLIFVDADNFKPINDEYGHHAGDQVLALYAQYMDVTLDEHITQRMSPRPEKDRPFYYICRVGGDEFAIVLLDQAQDRCLEVANALKDQIKRNTHLAQGKYQQLSPIDRQLAKLMSVSQGLCFVDFAQTSDLPKMETENGVPLNTVEKIKKATDTELYKVKNDRRGEISMISYPNGRQHQSWTSDKQLAFDF